MHPPACFALLRTCKRIVDRIAFALELIPEGPSLGNNMHVPQVNKTETLATEEQSGEGKVETLPRKCQNKRSPEQNPARRERKGASWAGLSQESCCTWSYDIHYKRPDTRVLFLYRVQYVKLVFNFDHATTSRNGRPDQSLRQLRLIPLVTAHARDGVSCDVPWRRVGFKATKQSLYSTNGTERNNDLAVSTVLRRHSKRAKMVIVAHERVAGVEYAIIARNSTRSRPISSTNHPQ